MKRIILFACILLSVVAANAQQTGNKAKRGYICAGNPKSVVPANLTGNWMFGKFSMTEYWTQNPSEYVGNAVQFAIAFHFNADGTYEQYFTSSSVLAGVVVYNQSVTRGTVVMDAATGTLVTYPCSSHYRRTKGGRVQEDRDMARSELAGTTRYSFTTGTAAGGTRAIYLTMQGTADPLTFLQKF